MTFRYEAEERWKGTNQRKGSEDNQIERLEEPEGLQLIVGFFFFFLFWICPSLIKMLNFLAMNGHLYATKLSHRAESSLGLHMRRQSRRKLAFWCFRHWETIVSAGSRNKVGTIANNFTFWTCSRRVTRGKKKTTQQRGGWALRIDLELQTKELMLAYQFIGEQSS